MSNERLSFWTKPLENYVPLPSLLNLAYRSRQTKDAMFQALILRSIFEDRR